MNNKGQIKLILWLIFIVGFIGFYFIGIMGENHGKHTGIVTATEESKYFLFGWDYKYVYFKTSEFSSQEDKYCVDDNSLYLKLQEAQKNKKQVTIKYDNDMFVAKWHCNTPTIITGVEDE